MFNSSTYNGIVYNGSAASEGGGSTPDIPEVGEVVNKKAVYDELKTEQQRADIRQEFVASNTKIEEAKQDIGKERVVQ